MTDMQVKNLQRHVDNALGNLYQLKNSKLSFSDLITLSEAGCDLEAADKALTNEMSARSNKKFMHTIGDSDLEAAQELDLKSQESESQKNKK